MAHAQERMLPKHSRTGVAHHLLDLIAAGALIAVDGAAGASGLLRSEAASLQPLTGIVGKLLALWAKVRAMISTAINFNHRHHGFQFPREAVVAEFLKRDCGFGGHANIITAPAGGRLNKSCRLIYLICPNQQDCVEPKAEYPLTVSGAGDKKFLNPKPAKSHADYAIILRRSSRQSRRQILFLAQPFVCLSLRTKFCRCLIFHCAKRPRCQFH